jgi:hypothetical protein
MMTSFECIFLESTLESPAGEVRVLCEAAAAIGSENKDNVREEVALRKTEANSLAACAAVACRLWMWVAKVGCGLPTQNVAHKGDRVAQRKFS